MVQILMTSANRKNPRRYVEILESVGAEVKVLIPPEDRPVEQLMEGVGGVLLPGGPDIDPHLYGDFPDPTAHLDLRKDLDDLDLRILKSALDLDMPVLAICRGMQLLNVACGGRLIQDLVGHQAGIENGQQVMNSHNIFLAPGSKAAAVIGIAGFFKVNSFHHQGVNESIRSPKLMTTGYSVEDGLIEALESPKHSWVIGFQCHLERQDEVPRSFSNLFAAFVERSDDFLANNNSR